MTDVKLLYWIGSSKKDLQSLPEDVQNILGYALYLAQVGGKHVDAKPLRGFGSAGMLEVVKTIVARRIVPSILFALQQRCLSCMSFKRNPRRESALQGMIST